MYQGRFFLSPDEYCIQNSGEKMLKNSFHPGVIMVK